MTRSASGEAPGGSSLLIDDADAWQLVRAAQQYDDRALGRLYQLYANRIFRYIYYRVGESSRAEELTGEVFVHLLEGIESFRLGRQGHALALTAWIYRIARNLIIDDSRRRKARGESAPLPEDWEGTMAADLREDFHLTRADLQVGLQGLTEEQQTVILLRYGEGMTNAEIGRILGKTETAVKALQRRALAALARYLDPTGAPQA